MVRFHHWQPFFVADSFSGRTDGSGPSDGGSIPSSAAKGRIGESGRPRLTVTEQIADSNSAATANFMQKVTGAEFDKLLPERPIDLAPEGYIWMCPKCGRKDSRLSQLNCGHRAADLYKVLSSN